MVEKVTNHLSLLSTCDNINKQQRKSHQCQADLIDDECSTDSGCSSGGSSESADRLSKNHHHLRHRNSSSEASSCNSNKSRQINTSINNKKNNKPARTHSQDRLSRISVNNQQHKQHQQRNERCTKASRSWSPSESRRKNSSSSPSDTQSSDGTSDYSSKKTTSKGEILKRAFQYFGLSENNNSVKEKKLTKKSPKRILREPVTYTYIKGLSGLPTQRVPKTTSHASAIKNIQTTCPCQNDMTRLYKKSHPNRR